MDTILKSIYMKKVLIYLPQNVKKHTFFLRNLTLKLHYALKLKSVYLLKLIIKNSLCSKQFQLYFFQLYFSFI